MEFWTAQLGPLWEEHIPTDDRERHIGTLACPVCYGTLARFVESPDGIGLRAFVRASSPTAPGSATTGFAVFTEVTDEQPADEAVADLHCWKGCSGHYRVNGAMCRVARDQYRATGKRPWIPALHVV